MFTLLCDDCGRTFLAERLQLQEEVLCPDCSMKRTEEEVERWSVEAAAEAEAARRRLRGTKPLEHRIE